MSNTIISDVLIIGSGPAGYTAGIYAARANLNTVITTGMQKGGQMTLTTDVENYPGFAEPIQGPWLLEQMEAQAKHVGVKMYEEEIQSIEKKGDIFECKSNNGAFYNAQAVIISTGASAKWLGLESEKEFMGHGISGCATCDGFFFKNKTVCVIGGGNTAVEEALYLTKHAKKVYLIHRRNELRAEKIMQKRLFENPKIECKFNFQVDEFIGEKDPIKYLVKVRLKSTVNESKEELELDGAFVAIGHKPNTDFCQNIIKVDNDGYIITEKGSTKTNIPGIFAAGDVQDKIYRQAVTAAGSGCMAALDAQHYLENLE